MQLVRKMCDEGLDLDPGAGLYNRRNMNALTTAQVDAEALTTTSPSCAEKGE